MNTATKAEMPLFAGFVLFSSGCGGGDSSTDGGDTNRPNPPTIGEPSQELFSSTSNKQNISQASRNLPKVGSVTQSSNASDGVTTDRVTAEVGYDGNRPSYALVRKTGGQGFTMDSRSDRSEQLPDCTGVQMLQCDTRGCNYVGVCAESTTATDYLAAGLWAFFPEDLSRISDFELGAFVDGSDPFTQQNLAGLTTDDTATTYRGEVTGVFSPPGGPAVGNFVFTAQVVLEVDFGDDEALGTIGATISNVRDEDGTPVNGNPQITLVRTNIGGSDSGFFTGDTSMNYRGASYEGKWGGQFFGNSHPTDEPGSVAGTFGIDAGNGSTALGVFMASQQ